MWNDNFVVAHKYSYLNLLSGDLRFSITSKCNMNCSYCHNEGGRVNNELSSSDVLRIVEQSMDYGTRSVRLTGGEPLLHKDILKICRTIKLNFPKIQLGVNTNAIEIDLLLNLIKEGYLNRVVIGIDYFDGYISKRATMGCSSKEILENVMKVKATGCRVDLSTVYDGDISNIENLVMWSFQNDIRIKILEEITDEIADQPSSLYQNMMNHIIKKFSLKLCFDITRKQYYAVSSKNNVVSFFHSHCKLRECNICSRLHLRVSCEGKTKSCLFPNTPEFSLLDSQNFQTNFLAGLSYLGTPPEEYSEKTKGKIYENNSIY